MEDRKGYFNDKTPEVVKRKWYITSRRMTYQRLLTKQARWSPMGSDYDSCPIRK